MRIPRIVFAMLVWGVMAICMWPGAAVAAKPLTTLTFDELPFQPVDGLSVQGIAFHYNVGGAPSFDAFYGAFGPGAITYVQDPSLEGGTAGTLTLDFAHPTKVLQFGLALSTFGDLTPGARVELFNPGGHSRGVIPLNTSSLISFTEGRFTYSGAAIGSAALTFSNAASRFALDNLSFTSQGSKQLTALVTRPAARASTQLW